MAEQNLELDEKELEGLYRRIEKMIKLASNNSNEHERDTAMLKVQQMLMQYNLSMEEVKRRTGAEQKKQVVQEYVEILEQKTMWWVQSLFRTLAPHFRCQHIHFTGLHGKYGCMGLVGLKEDVQILTEIIKFAKLSIIYFSETYIINQVNMYNNMPMKERPLVYQKWVTVKDFTGAKNDYIKGYIRGLGEKFTEQEKKNQQEWGLIIVKDPLVVKHVEEMHLTRGRNQKGVASSGDGSHFAKGRSDGKSYSHKNGMIAN